MSALLISKRDRTDIDEFSTDADEYEVEFVYKEEDNMYEIPLSSGHYMVVIKYPGLE